MRSRFIKHVLQFSYVALSLNYQPSPTLRKAAILDGSLQRCPYLSKFLNVCHCGAMWWASVTTGLFPGVCPPSLTTCHSGGNMFHVSTMCGQLCGDGCSSFPTPDSCSQFCAIVGGAHQSFLPWPRRANTFLCIFNNLWGTHFLLF
jgi:hypothetical protein